MLERPERILLEGRVTCELAGCDLFLGVGPFERSRVGLDHFERLLLRMLRRVEQLVRKIKQPAREMPRVLLKDNDVAEAVAPACAMERALVTQRQDRYAKVPCEANCVPQVDRAVATEQRSAERVDVGRMGERGRASHAFRTTTAR